MSTSDIGRKAEIAVAKHLQKEGYKILGQNWKTAVCEIDIVAEKAGVACLIEVKYRSSGGQGSGFDYIGPKKLRQMEFAAKVWAKESNWSGDVILMAAEVSGANYENLSVTEI